MIKVLFVCAGNICRSPMAEAVFQDMVNKTGLGDKITSDSAGTGSWHTGERPQPGTLKVLARQNIPYHGRARQLNRADFENFDYIVGMDHENLSIMQRYASNRGGDNFSLVRENLPDRVPEVGLFLRYAKEAGLVKVDEVPDPYYSGDEAFNRVYDLVLKGNTALLQHIRKKHRL